MCLIQRSLVLLLAISPLLLPLPGHTQSIDFVDLYRQAEQFHESVGEAAARASQLTEERRKVLAQLLPTLSVDGRYNRRQDEVINGGFTLRPKTSWDTTVRLNQALYTGGRASTRYKMATIAHESGQLGEVVAREQLIFTLAEAFFSELKAQENLTAVAERHEGMKRHLTAARARVRLGADVRASALRLEAEVAQLAAQRLAAENELQSARESLAVLSGLPPEMELGTPPDLSTIATVANSENTALAARTDLGILAGETAAAALGIRFTTGTFLPFISAEARYEKSGEKSSAVSFLVDADKVVTLSATWDLYTGGENAAERRRTRAAYREKKLQLERTEREVRVAVQQAQRRVDVAGRIVESLTDRVNYATENHRIVTETYKAGAATYLDVIDASNALGDARSDLANARFDHSLALLGLAGATGQLMTIIGEPAPDLSAIHNWLARYGKE
ncbi:MAG: TolC family protein [Nitrospirota bacterium]|nr:TolC family protein [Nitrospirota bacterium]